MSSGVSQVYQLRFQIGEQDVSLTPSSMNTFEITEYIDRFLPTIYCDLNDSSGLITHLVNHDSRFNTLTVNFSNDSNPDTADGNQTDVTFKLFRRKPESVEGYANTVLFEGILNVENMFNPSVQRGWVNTSIADIIANVLDDTTFDEVNINVDVAALVNLCQPNWSNAQFLNYIAKYLKSDSGECGYLAYTDLPNFKTTRFNFVPLTALLKQQPKFTYLAAPTTSSSTEYPIFKSSMIDNYDLISHLGVSQQVYGYFDYVKGVYVQNTINITDVDFKSLSTYFAYDVQDNIPGLSQNYLGITDDFVLPINYDGLARGAYYKKLNSLIKMNIVSIGNNQLSPGDIITVVFPETGDEDNITPKNATIASYQYSGNWLVERIKHQFGATYTNEILLTRPGFDSDLSTTFLKAPK